MHNTAHANIFWLLCWTAISLREEGNKKKTARGKILKSQLNYTLL
jgi:hypothetical protein